MKLNFFIILSSLLLFLGCSDKEKEKQNRIKTIEKKELKSNEKIVTINDLNITFKNKKLIYPKKRVFLLFCANSTFCKMQESVLKDLNISYYKTQNSDLKNYFNIKIEPTIVILDKNKTIKYENFVPLEILKTEGY